MKFLLQQVKEISDQVKAARTRLEEVKENEVKFIERSLSNAVAWLEILRKRLGDKKCH